ncbi:MAG: hypothetical protein CSB01_01725 [Bacteroidia bacterium]|nr:MAG: hypothetical protein CSB01_01725 [Bacteroidia bacterium]
MKFIFTLLLFTSFFALLGQQTKELDESLTGDEVVEKYIQALGGKSAIKNIKYCKIKLDIFLDDVYMQGFLYQKEPDNYLMYVVLGDDTIQTHIFNGKKGKYKDIEGETEFYAEELDEFRYNATNFIELYFHKLGFVAEMQGIEKLGEYDVYKVEITKQDERKQIIYYEGNSGLKVKTIEKKETREGRVDYSVVYRKYKIIKGVKFPFEKVVRYGKHKIIMNVVAIDVKNKFNDNIFKIK